ncbi:DUF2254 domain-containing protein [Ramlibacter alkalitolerans]|uniref:DUF2254 domain-containing protein n=1 Tax=Ramlibacter alkalitolerans TaxID=2039631 RepID=A0ABS1JKS8_9BURK|nr:DUF2254 domain-containing protein [Ramlibacter alkalitolerans]MBL0424716.1 DUF2254 domain-containing protein [Ramlibacter alkalitolerans]
MQDPVLMGAGARLSLRRLWVRLRASFWFTPALIVLASMLVAVVLVEFDAVRSADLARWSPRLFGAGADGSRAMLSAIATSMITVAGVVFSITIVTLSLTATEYSPRVLRNFMRDAPTQVVLGVFVGIFAYCLVVLRTIRGGDEGEFIPSVAVLVGLGYAFAGIGVLIYFIHHVALSIQASSILGRIAADTERAIDHLFPQEVGEALAGQAGERMLPRQWHTIQAHRSGYVQSVDADVLLRYACERDTVVRLCVNVGQYVSEGTPLLEAGLGGASTQQLEALRSCVGVGRQRTVEQDAAFGLQQLVDVALRALSPGVNDPTTACMCVNELGRLLARLVGRAMPESHRFGGGRLRVIATVPDFGRMVDEALLPVVRYAAGNQQVLAHVADALARIREAAPLPARKAALRACFAELRAEVARVRPRRRSAALRRRLRDMEAGRS